MFLRKIRILRGSVKGFSFIELMVSISVMAILLGVSISGGPQAIARYSLVDGAYKTEILLREAQLQGSAVNSVNNQFAGSGVYFDLASSSQVIKFKDKVVPDNLKTISVGDGVFTNGVDETNSTVTLVNRNRVAKVCVALNTDPFECSGGSGGSAINTLTVSFTRPKQTAHIYANNATTTDYTSACIQIDSPKAPAKGYVRSILVYRSGLMVKKEGTCL